MNPDLYLSGFVQRWHTHPTLARLGQTLAHHQWGVTTLIMSLHGRPSVRLIRAALWHDVGEIVYGDVPYSAKSGNPELAALLSEAESQAAFKITGYYNNLSESDNLWLAMCDRLEAYLYVKLVAPALLESEDWVECLAHIKDMAQDLDVLDDLPI